MKHLLWALWLISTISFGQVVIEGNGQKVILPDGKYTITVGKQSEPEVPKPSLPDCGCGKPDFEILSVTKKQGSTYEVKFDACNVSPLTWNVANKAATFPPTSPVFEIDLTGVVPGEYNLKITSTGCNGKAEKKFYVVGNGVIEPPQEHSNPDENTTATPEIVYFNYDDTGVKLSEIDLKVERGVDGKIYLKDNGRAPYAARYAINGSVNRLSAKQLSNQPIPAGQWIHIVKFIADVDNINTSGWLTSTQYSGRQDVKYAKSYECTFYVEDGTRPDLKYTQPLWAKGGGVSDGLSLSRTPRFVLNGKLYGCESRPENESEEQLRNISWALGEKAYQLVYAGDVKRLTDQLGKGITQLNDGEIDRAADMLAAMSNGKKYFAVDFEPSDPEKDGWRWDYDAGSFRSTMQKLSKRIFDRHGKYFYSWIGKGNQFSFRGKSFELDGYSNDSWGKSLDTYIALHENPSEITNVNLAAEPITQVGFGYNSITISSDVNQPASRWVSPSMWYLRFLDVVNVQTLITPKTNKLLAFIWPYEDQPSDAKRTPMTRFKFGQGYINVQDNRVQFAHNLVRDAIITYLCNPRVVYTQYWIFGTSYNPGNLLRWSKINERLSCYSEKAGGHYVSTYKGPDNPPCPTTGGDYIGKDALSVSAMVQAHEVFANHLQNVCDGSQVREAFNFVSFTRSGVESVPVHKNDTGEFARAYKYQQPWAQVWRNPNTGKRVLLYQDTTAEAFEPCSFTVIVDGMQITRSVKGNELYFEVL